MGIDCTGTGGMGMSKVIPGTYNVDTMDCPNGLCWEKQKDKSDALLME